MSNNTVVLLKIKPVWDSSNTFEKVDRLVNGTKKKVDDLNNSYRTKGKTIGQLREKVVSLQKAYENTDRADHRKKYNLLIGETKKKIDELENSARACGERTQSIFKSMVGANLFVKGLSMAKSVLTGFAKDSMDTYQKHNVARTQLDQVMRNTMGGGKWDTDDIVAVTKEQQKLGVVSSNVQLSGAKELATYIRKKESLEKLIPTMNNMLTHQYGLNASQENAYNIAQMMGKVLEGQTGALARNGYWFTEAQEKVLKYGNESERVATLMEVIEQSVKGVNEALAATPEGKAKQLAMEYDELKVRAGEALTKLKAQTMSYVYENRKGFIVTAKVVGTATTALVTYKVVSTSLNALSKVSISTNTLKALSWKSITAQISAATKAKLTYKTVTKALAGPVGLLTAAVAAGASAWLLFRRRNKEAEDGMKSAREAYSSFYAQERTQLDAIFAKLRQTNPKSAERKRLVKELAELYPELNKQTLDEITNTNKLAAAYDAASASIRKKALTKAYEGATQSAYEKGTAGEGLLRGAVGYELSDEQVLKIAQQYLDAYKKGGRKGSQGVVEFSKENKKVIETFITSRKEAEHYSKLAASARGDDQTTVINNTNTNNYTSTASDAITGGGRQVKNFYINIDSLIKENTNMFQSSKDDPQSAQDFMSEMSEALQRVVNDANYAAAG